MTEKAKNDRSFIVKGNYYSIMALGCCALLRFKVQRTDKYKEENGLSKEILPKYFVQYNSNIKSHFKHCVAKLTIIELSPHE